jgi:hypothetical protein
MNTILKKDTADYISKLSQLAEESNSTWPPTSANLTLAYEALKDWGTNRGTYTYAMTATPNSTVVTKFDPRKISKIMGNDGGVLHTLQYLTVLHLTITDDIFSFWSNPNKKAYETYKINARKVWRWKSEGRVNFKNLVDNEMIKNTEIQLTLRSRMELVNFLNELWKVIDDATKNIESVKRNPDYLKKILEQKRSFLPMYDAIHRVDSGYIPFRSMLPKNHVNYISFQHVREGSGGKHTSRKNKKRKHRTHKRKH